VAAGSVAGLLTDRRYDDGSRNTVVSVDGLMKPSNDSRLRAQLSHSETSGKASAQRGHVVYADALFDDGKTHLFGKMMEVSPQFRADTGFIVQNGFREMSGEAWRCTARKGFINQVCPGVNASVQRTTRGEAISESVAPNVFLQGERASEWNLSAKMHARTRTREGGVFHRVPTVNLRGAIRPNSSVLTFVEANFEVGRAVDVLVDERSALRAANVSLSLRPHPRLETELSLSGLELHDLHTDALRLREAFAQWVNIGYVTANDTVRLIAQRSETTRHAAIYPAALNVSPRTSSTAVSLVFGKRWGLSRDLNVGLTWSEARVASQPASRTLEAFVKVGWSVQASLFTGSA
jgi:hypothetical protein